MRPPSSRSLRALRAAVELHRRRALDSRAAAQSTLMGCGPRAEAARHLAEAERALGMAERMERLLSLHVA